MTRGFYHPDRGYWQAVGQPVESGGAGEQAEIDPLQSVIEGYPEGTIEVPLKPGPDFDWVQGDAGGEWVHVPPSIEDQRAELRPLRDALLSASDWTQMPDSPLSEVLRAAWAEYRQALRDLPQAADLSLITWPDPPE